MRAPFSVFKRPSRDRSTGKEVVRFVARFYDDEGAIVKTRTLDATNKTAAVLEAKRLLDKGEGISSSDPLALDFLLDFWKSDSDYAKMKALRGRPLSLHYVEINASVIRKHLSEPLKGVRFHELTVVRMEKIVLKFAAAGMNPRSINFLIQAVRVPVTDWARRHRVGDPLQYLQRVAERPRERGTLSLDEVAKIAALEGESPRVKAAVLLGALCGLRMGEARGLEWADIDEEAGLLHVVHNWVDDREGVKRPKCGSSRDVPLPSAVLEAVKLCRAVSTEGSQFVLFNEKRTDKPTDKQVLERGFRRVLSTIGISDSAREERNLVFHGLRHTFISLQRANGIPDFAVMRLAGHKSLAMTERYSHADKVVDFAAARAALDDAIAAKAAGGEK
jgi:Site-specific recombinase XerD